jgi:hypothetical protein
MKLEDAWRIEGDTYRVELYAANGREVVKRLVFDNELEALTICAGTPYSSLSVSDSNGWRIERDRVFSPKHPVK